MYLIVRKGSGATYGELLAAAAQATVACATTYASSAKWGEAMSEWYEQSFRKVTLRADESEWEKLARFTGSRALVAGQEVLAALPPRRKSEREPLLRRLQVFNADSASLPEKKVRELARFPNLLVVMNGHVEMSAGKAIAQVGHAALAAIRDTDPHALTLWQRKGCPVDIAAAGETQWGLLRALPEACLIRDNGLTEVDPGTETALAFPPSLRPVEPALVRSLARP